MSIESEFEKLKEYVKEAHPNGFIRTHEPVEDCVFFEVMGTCYHCCERCNLDLHICHFCGDCLDHHDNVPGTDTNPCYE